jgi:hypothetical protein
VTRGGRSERPPAFIIAVILNESTRSGKQFLRIIKPLFIPEIGIVLMAKGVPKRPRGRPPGKSDAKDVWFRLPPHHYDYLRHLVMVKKRFGDTPNDAAKFILMRELDAMFRGDFHKKEIE